MTILIASITPDFVVLSQDTFFAPAAPQRSLEASSNAAECHRSAYIGDGTAPDVKPVSFATKISVLPHLRMLMGGFGEYEGVAQWGALLMRYGMVCNVRELNTVAPLLLREIHDWLGGAVFGVVNVGYVPEDDAFMGFAYMSADNFEPVPLGLGHTLMPVPNADDPDYPALYDAWAPAANGIGTTPFHRMVAINIHHAYSAGAFEKGCGMGGELHTAHLDREGFSIRTTHEFPGFRDQQAALKIQAEEVIAADPVGEAK